MHDLPIGTVTFLFTDIVGSTPLWEKMPRAMRASLAMHNDILSTTIQAHGGRVFKVIGDAFQAAFVDPAQAVEAAIATQLALGAASWNETGQIQVRMGIHAGQAEMGDGDYIASHTLNRVARIMSAGHAGQILLSLTMAELVRGNLPGDVRLKDLGEHYLKGMSHPEHIFQVIAPGLMEEFPPLATKHVPRGYKLLEQIGVGGFGAVYRAVQPEVGREVAVKVILPPHANEPEFIRRFEAEAQTVARLEHPNIVPLYDYWREPDGAYLVMRWVRGGSLAQRLSNGRLEVETALRLAGQIAAALDAAHEQGVIHRDLKPDNILIDESGNAYLSDFGIAKHLSGNGRHTLTGMLVGSPAYTSPEQLLKEAIAPSADIYSFGVLLFHMLTGELPFQSDSLAALIDQHLHQPLPAATSICPDLPEQIDEILARATAKDPEQRYPDASALVDALKDAFSGLRVAKPETAGPPEVLAVELHNPFKGLRAFQEADAGDFFGRDALVERLLSRLSARVQVPYRDGRGGEEVRFLAVIGPSGSGKSSLVKAGLIPALRAGRLPGSENWFIVEMLPGTHPMEEMEAALLRVAVNPPASLLAQLQEDERGLVRAVKRVLPGGEDAELLLVIDQFEETFTLVEDREEARVFIDSLVAAVSDPRGRVRVVITLRADFYDRPLMIPNLSQLVQAGAEVVVPLTAEELLAAIQEPALKVGARFEEGLIPRIIADVNDQPGTLPLLQYSLTELFERREGDLLTKTGYEEIGGVLGALSRRAEEVYQGLDKDLREMAWQVFLRLVTLGEGVEDTRRRVLRSELESLTPAPDPPLPNLGEGPGVRVVLDAFGHARLLSFDRDPETRGPTVEVAHEALLREWGRLRGWLEESREDLRLQRGIDRLAREWENSGQDTSFLLRGSRLDQFERWSKTTQVRLALKEQAYLEASLAEREVRRAAEAERRAREVALEKRSRNFLRVLLAVMAVATLVSLYLAVFAFQQRDSAQQNEALAERSAVTATAAQGQAQSEAATAVAAKSEAQAASRLSTSRELVRFAEAEMQDPTDPSFSLALLLARQAVLTTWEPDGFALDEAERALRSTINTAPILDHVLPGPIRRAYFAAWSPDGMQVVSAGSDGVARLWDAASGERITELDGHSGEVRTADWSPDGARLLTASRDRTVRIWDAASGTELNSFSLDEPANSAFWSQDGAKILVAAGGTVRILDAGSGNSLLDVGTVTGNFNFASWSPSGDRFATADDINIIQVWDAATGEQLRLLDADRGPVFSVNWSADGNYLLSSHSGNLARIWDLQGGAWLDLEHGAQVQFAAWSPDDNQVATVTAQGEIAIWDPLTGKLVRRWHGFDGIIWSVAWSPDGAQLLTADDDGAARIWEAKSLEERNRLRHQGPVQSLAWSPGGDRLLTAGGLTLSADVWDLGSSTLLKQLPHPGSVSAVAWSPEGGQLATASLNTVYLWDASTWERMDQFSVGSGNISTLAWSGSGAYLVVGGQDRSVRILDAATGETLRALEGHTGEVRSASWSRGESRIVTASADGTARVWDVSTGQETLTLQDHQDRVNAAVFSPDGSMILTASSDHTARIWDANTGELQHVLEGHNGEVWSAAWNPDGDLVATAGNDGLVLLWDPASGERGGEAANHAAIVWSIAWSPDGTRLASAGQDGVVRISPVGIEGLLAQAEALISRDPPEFTGEERCLYLHECDN